MIHVYEVCDNWPTYICLQGELVNKFEDDWKILEADIVNELYTFPFLLRKSGLMSSRLSRYILDETNYFQMFLWYCIVIEETLIILLK